ncbi:hypothetical protein H0H93_002734 [Arthromyces matolae]|nr:hypothetical protein H0H93_002734 [Arthromyces matolae]
MTAASIGFGWAALSRAFSYSASRPAVASLALHVASHSTITSGKPVDVQANAAQPAVDFVGNQAKLTHPGDPLIFETQSEDYTSIVRDAPPRTPKIMNLVQSTLPLRLPKPTPLDNAIFEDSLEDGSLGDYSKASIAFRYPPSSVVETLENLIREEKYMDAYRFCEELLESNVEVPTSLVYERAVLAAFHATGIERNHRLAHFRLWLSGLPFSHELAPGLHKQSIRRLKEHIFLPPRPDLKFTITFSIVMAGKGHAQVIARSAIPYILRFADPRASARFISNFLQAAIDYTLWVDPERRPSTQAERDSLRIVRKQELVPPIISLAIENFARLGHFKEAMSFLPNAEDPFRLSMDTYDYLLTRLSQSQFADAANYVQIIQALRSDQTYCYRDSASKTIQIVESDTKSAARAELAKETDSNSPHYIGGVLANDLQHLIGQIRRSELSATDLTSFFNAYYGSGRCTAIYYLGKLALNQDRPTGGIFLYVQMSYFLNQGLYPLVLKTFADYFYFHGVPEEEVTRYLPRLKLDAADHSHPAYTIQQSYSKRRWFPTESHADLAWHALARSVPLTELDDLWVRFIDYLASIRQERQKYRSSEDTVVEDEAQLSLPPYIKHQIGSSVFTVFLDRLFRPGQSRPAQVLFDEMIKVGINPSIHHYTLLATYYVTLSDIKRAFMVINMLEAQHPVEKPIPMEEALKYDRTQGPESGIPAPDVIFYTSVFAELSRCEYVDSSTEVLNLFSKRFIYTEGVDPLFDAAFSNWRRLKARLRKQEFEYRASPKASSMIAESPKHSAASRAMAKPLKRGRACMNCRLEARLHELEHPDETTPSVTLHDPYSAYHAAQKPPRSLLIPEARPFDPLSPFSPTSSSASLPSNRPWRSFGAFESESAGSSGSSSSPKRQYTSSPFLGTEFLPNCQEFGFFLNPNRFREATLLPVSFGHPSRPTPAVLSAVYLWGVHLSHSEALLRQEQSFLTRALQHAVTDAFGTHPDVILHTLQAELPMSVCGTLEAPGIQVDTPWPLDISGYSEGLLHSDIRGNNTIRHFLLNMVETAHPGNSLTALNVKAAILFHRAAQLAGQWMPNMQPREFHAYTAAFQSIHRLIESFRSTLPPLVNLDTKHPTTRTLLLIHALADAATIKLHINFSYADSLSKQHCLVAARRIVAFGNINISDVGPVNPIMGVGRFCFIAWVFVDQIYQTLWVAACHVFIDEISRVRSSGESWPANTLGGEDELMERLRSGMSALSALSEETPFMSSDGIPPYRVLIIPFGASNLPNNTEVRTIVDQPFPDGASSVSFKLNYPANTQFVAVMSDATSFGSGGTSVAVEVASSSDSSCFDATKNVAPDFFFNIEPPNQIVQCTSTRLWWDNSTVQGLPNFLGVIPGGQSFSVPESSITNVASQGTGFSWTPSLRGGTTLIIVGGDSRGNGTAGSSLNVVSSGPNNIGSCLNDASPSSTPGTPAGGSYATSTSSVKSGGGGGTNVGAIVGGVVGGVIGLVALGLIFLFFVRRSRIDNNKKEKQPLNLLHVDEGDEAPTAGHTTNNRNDLPEYYQPEPFTVPDPTIASTYEEDFGGTNSEGRPLSGYTTTDRSGTPDLLSSFGAGSTTASGRKGGLRQMRPINIIQHDDAGPSEPPRPDDVKTFSGYFVLSSDKSFRSKGTTGSIAE